MDCFVDCRVVPDADFTAPILMNALFSKLHRRLCDTSPAAGPVLVSFPEYAKTLGGVLRLHGTREALEQRIGALDWIGGLSGYVRRSVIHPVPETAEYVSVRRVHGRKDASRFRRLVRRGRITQQQADQLIAERPSVDLPYLRLASNSNGQTYCAFVSQHRVKGPVHAPADSVNSLGFVRDTGAVLPFFQASV